MVKNLSDKPTRLFCSNCRMHVHSKIIKVPTFVGSVIYEYYCPNCGKLLKKEEKPFQLPDRENIIKKSKIGIYIAFEGINGAGKTYYSQKLARYLNERGYSVVYVREPWIKAIKEFLYKHDLDPDVETYIFAADRIILQKEIILTALAQGKIVISDRSIYSSLAYQGARGLNLEFIWAINRSIRLPDLVILLDIPVNEALKRLRRISRKLTKFEEPKYLDKVRRIFLDLAKTVKYSSFVIIDVQKEENEVFREIIDHVEKFIKKRWG